MLISLNTYAEKSLRKNMLKLAKNMEEIFPHVYDQESFTSAYHKKFLQKKLKQTQELIKSLKPHFDVRSKAYQVNYSHILEHVDLTVNVFNQGHLEFARNTLKALPSLCISCHTQDAKAKKIFHNVSRKKFPTDLAYAEFNFMTRNFSIAKKYYDKYIYDHMKTGNYNTVADALKNKVLLQSILLKNPKKLQQELKEMKKVKNILPMLRNDIMEFQEGVQSLKIQKMPEDFSVLKKIVTDSLKETNGGTSSYFLSRRAAPTIMQSRQLLYEYLNSKANKDEIPQILLMLAQTDKKLNFNLFYGLSDLYLKSCIKKFPKSSVAGECYKQYKEQIEFGFTGSGGVHLPDDVKEELEKMKKLMD